jgi:ArsR family transcriptional regulator, arsenate/arsenite/antimonite-responsive transcriptional repressor
MSIELFGCRGYGNSWKAVLTGGDADEFATPREQAMKRSAVEIISKALADPTRLRIFEAISASENMTCGQIVSMRGVTPATVSHHLKILSEAGLITCRREGQFVYSRSVPETIDAYMTALAEIAGGRKASNRR